MLQFLLGTQGLGFRNTILHKVVVTVSKVIGMVFAGGRVEDYSILTERRPKSAVVIGGIYRTLDFALTNLVNTNVGQIGILVQYRPSSLIDHVGTGLAWDLLGPGRGVRFLPPSLGPKSGAIYRGPGDALYQNIDFIERNAPTDVLAVSADHVYSMDYGTLLSFHHERGADLTMAFTPIDNCAGRFGIGELNAEGQILNFTEKPEHPRTNLASMSVYVFRREVLVDELTRSQSGENGTATFQIHEVLRRMIARRRAYGYVFHGAWAYTRTLDEYYALHKSMLGPQPAVDLAAWHVRTNVTERTASPHPPPRFLVGAQVEDSIISPGCVIAGTVVGSVLSPGVRVAPGAVVRDSVVWDDVVVEEGASLKTVISDKRVRFGRGAVVGEGQLAPSDEVPQSLTCGASVFGMDVRVPGEARIGKNVIVHPGARSEDLAMIASGRSVQAPSRRK